MYSDYIWFRISFFYCRATQVEEEVPEPDQVEMEDDEKKGTAADEEKELAKLMQQQTYITPSMARDHLRQLWGNDKDLLKQVFGEIDLQVNEEGNCPMDIFFLSILPVPPSRFRPVSVIQRIY